MSLLFNSPAAGFDQPLAVLRACHERIQRQCQTLQRLEAHLAQNGVDESARQAAQAVLRYFDIAGVHHHADEEDDLFPLLRGHTEAPGHAGVLAGIEQLERDHRRMEQAWAALRDALQRLIDGDVTAYQPGQVHEFVALYQQHIELEERAVYDPGETMLTPAELTRLGQAMAQRRGVAFAT
jgi:hemerythrin-like domain-containing protein